MDLSHLPPAIAEQIAAELVANPDRFKNVNVDTSVDAAAIVRSRREALWARTCPEKYKDASLGGMITTEAKAVADWYRTATGDLLLWSETPGGGKTHTGHAILNKALSDTGARVYATNADKLMDSLTGEADEEIAIESARAEYLLVDELAKSSRPGWVVGKLWGLYDERHLSTGKRTIFTSNAHPDMIAAAYPSIMSRIREGGALVHITHPDRRAPVIVADRLA